MKAYNSDITVEEFIHRYAKLYDPTTDNYFREPFARDVSEGKISDLFQAHSYHTKIPVDAIISYLEHYTERESLVFDPFCGSGMTGAACIIAKRIGILSDLSPAACHIASNYCYPFQNCLEYGQEVLRILNTTVDIEKYLYGSKCRKYSGLINIAFTVWNDVFKCSRCESEILFITSVIPKKSGEKRTFVQCNNNRCKLIEDKTYLPLFEK